MRGGREVRCGLELRAFFEEESLWMGWVSFFWGKGIGRVINYLFVWV